MSIPGSPRLSPEDSLLNRIRGRALYLSFSGGSDSTALLLWMRSAGLVFTAVHFTHGIRSEEDGRADLFFCRTFCERFSIPFLHEDLDVPGNRTPGEGIEECARRLRISAWKRILGRNSKNSAVFLAHHADDRVETMFLRLMRGGNASSLAGLRPYTEIDGMTFVRPLLNFTKSDLMDFLKSQGVTEWMTDATNSEEGCARNFLRLRILPEFTSKYPFASKGFAAALDALEDDACFLEEETLRQMKDADLTSAAFWRTLAPAIRVRALRKFLSMRMGKEWIPDGAFLARFEEALAAPGPQALPLGGNTETEFYFLRGTVTLRRAKTRLPDLLWNWQNHPEISFAGHTFRADVLAKRTEDAASEAKNSVWFDADRIPGEILLSLRREGDRMRPFGAAGEKKLKEILIDDHIAPDIRSNAVVLRAGGEILWVPWVRRSASAPCSPETVRFLHLTAEA